MDRLPTITALAPWFGAKRNLAPVIVEELGPHRVYWEPFCGSMAVLMIKPACGMETVNDLHGELVNLARMVADDSAYRILLRRLRRTLCFEGWPKEAKERLYGNSPPSDPIDRAYWYFLESWMGRNGCAGTFSTNTNFCRRFTGNGGAPAKRLQSTVESIPAWHRRLRNVAILQTDAFELLPKIDDSKGTVIYVDPPYLVKGAKYIHDFALADHQRLADALARFHKARVVCSYYDHPALAGLYPKWTQRKIDVSKAMANAGARGKNDTRAVEVLLINGPSRLRTDGDKQQSFLGDPAP